VSRKSLEVVAEYLKVIQVLENFWFDKETVEITECELAGGVVQILQLKVKKLIQQENLELEWNSVLEHKVISYKILSALAHAHFIDQRATFKQ
jgi:hypothetical protein